MFPRTPVIDNFNRSNEGPPPSSSWSRGFSNIFGQWEVTGNQCTVDSAANGYCLNYWSAATFGPACSVYATVITKPADGQRLLIMLRANDMASYLTVYGYALQLRCQAGTDVFEFVRYDAGAVTTVIGSAINQEISNGDSIGIKAVGSRFEIWHKPAAGSWSLVGVRTDTTYNAAGYITLGTTSTATVIDNYGAGTDTMLWEEGFEGTGYELSDWLEYVDANSIVNEDWAYTNALPGSKPATSAGDSCLRIVRGASPDYLCGTTWDWDSFLTTARVYARAYVMFTSENQANDTISDLFFRLSQGSQGSTCFGVGLRKSSSGALSFRGAWHESDGLHYGTSDYSIFLNRWYRVELYAERVGAGADCWTLRVNGATVESRTNCTFDRLLGGVRLGPYGTINYGETESYYDLLALNSTNWCGPAEGELETLSDLATSISSVTDLRTFVESLSDTISTQDSITDVRQMLESLSETITGTTTTSDVAQRLESLSETITATTTISDIRQMLENLLVEITSVSGVSDSLAGAAVENLLETITAETSVSDAQQMINDLSAIVTSVSTVTDIGLLIDNVSTVAQTVDSASDVQAYTESLQTVIASADSVTDVLAVMETLTETITSVSSVTDAIGLVEILTATIRSAAALSDLQTYADTLSETITSVSSVSDLQTFIQDLQILIVSHTSLAEIQAFIEHIYETSISGSSLTDVLSGAFVGAYLRGCEVPVRSMTAEVPVRLLTTAVPVRSFTTEVPVWP